MPAVPLQVTAFDVEGGEGCPYDSLTVGGKKYCGTKSPDGVTVSGAQGKLEWRADYSVAHSGWEVCWSTTTTGGPAGKGCWNQRGAVFNKQGDAAEVFDMKCCRS